MKLSSLLILILFVTAGYSQNTLNAYKYVLVPERFDFSKEDNQYGLNTTTKILLEQKGFTVFYAGEQLPPALMNARCNMLKAEMTAKNGMFVTSLTLLLKDCQGNTIFKGKEGKSREKDFPVAYDEALRNAFASLNAVPYKYDSTLLAQPPSAAVTATTTAPVTAPATTSAPATVPPAPVAADISGTLYAQATANGYQLVDMTPKKVLTLLKTSAQDYFIAEGGGISGIVFKKEGAWLLEYYKDDKLVSRKLDIKF
ncbi:MAG: hypothetical protein JST39_23070 [Bacteroidetes bacterium]|nr:hypothetical protein [Bacteroidota bacterium]